MTFTTVTDLSSGTIGFAYSIGVGEPITEWVDVAGAASSQSIVVDYASLGAVSGNTVNILVGWSSTNPATDPKTYAVSPVAHVLT